jgi:hypothetical protein
MSTRGGYGFILDSKEIIVYTGGGAELTGLGSSVLEFLHGADWGTLKIQLSQLKEADSEDMVSEQDIQEAEAVTSTIPYTKHNRPVERWEDLLYPAQHDISYLLDFGRYIDGSWVIDSVDLEFFYLINLDTQSFQVYHGYRRDNPDNGYFTGRIPPSRWAGDGRLPVLLATFSLDELPNELWHLEDVLWD